jgi:trimethylamine--corrinoid protein Co-methyltransferase
LRILEQVGVQINENDFLQFLARNGLNVDYDEKRVKMPPYLIEECIKKAPKNVTLHAREPKHNISLEERKIYAHPVGGAANVIDIDSRARYSVYRRENSWL